MTRLGITTLQPCVGMHSPPCILKRVLTPRPLCMQESLFRQARPAAAGASHAGPGTQSPLPSPRAEPSPAAPLSPNPNMGLGDVLMLASLGVSGSASPGPGRTGPRGEPGGFGAATGPGGFLGARLGALGSKRAAPTQGVSCRVHAARVCS